MLELGDHVGGLALVEVRGAERLPFAPAQPVDVVELSPRRGDLPPGLGAVDEAVREGLRGVAVGAVDGVGKGGGREDLARAGVGRLGAAAGGQGADLDGVVGRCAAGGGGGCRGRRGGEGVVGVGYALDANVGAARGGEDEALGADLDPGVLADGADVPLAGRVGDEVEHGRVVGKGDGRRGGDGRPLAGDPGLPGGGGLVGAALLQAAHLRDGRGADELVGVEAEEGRGGDDARLEARDHVEDVAVLLARVQAHAAANHLDEQVAGAGGAGEHDAVDVGDVGALGEDAAVDEHGEGATLEGVEERGALGAGRVAGDGAGVEAVVVELLRETRDVREVDAEDEGGLAAGGLGHPAAHRDVVDLLRVDDARELAGLEVAKGAALDLGQVGRRLDGCEDDVGEPLVGNHVDVVAVVDNLVDGGAELEPIEARKRGRHADEHGGRGLLALQAKVLERAQVAGGDDVVRLVDEDELELRRVKLGEPVARGDAHDAGNGNVGGARGVQRAHLNVERLVRVGEAAVPRRLLDELPPVREDERALAARVGARVDLVYELGEDDLR